MGPCWGMAESVAKFSMHRWSCLPHNYRLIAQSPSSLWLHEFTLSHVHSTFSEALQSPDSGNLSRAAGALPFSRSYGMDTDRSQASLKKPPGGSQGGWASPPTSRATDRETQPFQGCPISHKKCPTANGPTTDPHTASSPTREHLETPVSLSCTVTSVHQANRTFNTPLGDIHPSTQLAQTVSSQIFSLRAFPRSLSHMQTSSVLGPSRPSSSAAWFSVTLAPSPCSTNGQPQRAKDHPRLQSGKDTPRAKPHPRDFTPPHPPASSPAL